MFIHSTDVLRTSVALFTKQFESDVAVVTQGATRLRIKLCKELFLAVLGIHSPGLLDWVSQAGSNSPNRGDDRRGQDSGYSCL